MKLADLHRLAARERLERIRQFARLRHVCPIDQNRDDTNVAGKRRCNFDDHEVVRIIQPPPAALIFCFQPAGTNNHQNNVARSDLAVQMRYEINAGRNVVDVHENIFASKCLRQSIVQSTGSTDRIFSAVIYENRTHGPSGP